MTTPPRADSPDEQARYVTHDQTIAWIGPPPGEMPGQENNGRPQLREQALERKEKLVARRGDGIYLPGNTWWLDFRHRCAAASTGIPPS